MLHTRDACSPAQLMRIMAAPACLAVLLRIIFFQGLAGADDLEYVRFATFWDHVPANHWEARVFYNATLRMAIHLFGQNELAYAAPGFLATGVLILSVAWCACRLSGPRAALFAGLVVASLPLDVTFSTVPLTGSLCAAFAAIGTVLLVGTERRLQRALGCVALALSILTHVTAIFYAGALTVGLLVTATTNRERLRVLLQGSVIVLLFMAGEFCLFAALTGDPFHEFRIVSAIRYADADFPLFSRQWFLWPVHTWVASKHFGVTISLASGLAPFGWRRLHSPLRTLALAITVFWLWFGWGTLSPVAYQPFWRELRYAHLLTAPLAILLGGLLADRGKIGALMTGCIVASGILLLAVSGTWGQNVEISRDMLAYVRAHPRTVFVTDRSTQRHLAVLSQFGEISNVQSWEHVPPTDGPVAMLINPLNPEPAPTTLHRGVVLHSTAPAYRPIAVILPKALVSAQAWFIRRPSGQVVEVLTRPAT